MAYIFQQHTHKLRILELQAHNIVLVHPSLEISRSQPFTRTQNSAWCRFPFLFLCSSPAVISPPDSSFCPFLQFWLIFYEFPLDLLVSQCFRTLPWRSHLLCISKSFAKCKRFCLKELIGPAVKIWIVSPHYRQRRTINSTTFGNLCTQIIRSPTLWRGCMFYFKEVAV